MGVLSTNHRNHLRNDQFAGPNRSYPIPDKAHAANAKARAEQQFKAGRISASERNSIDAKANKVLNK